jgi:uncharacterized protein
MSQGKLFDRSVDMPSNPSAEPTIGDVIARRFVRRYILKGALAATTVSAIAGPLLASVSRPAMADAMPSFRFDEIVHGVDETHHVAPGYDADVLIRWGDPVLPGAPAFDPLKQTAAAQAQQFGYNCDFIGYAPLPRSSTSPSSAILCVNQEYTSEELMFPGVPRQDRKGIDFKDMTKQLVDIEMAAHGASLVEVRREGAKWQLVKDSRYNRRITAETPMRIAGPAAGHDRLKTKADPTGTRVNGMLNNCAGGMTPWGTYLSAEENFHGYFWGSAEGTAEAANHKRYGVPEMGYAWGKYYDRFDVAKEPNEANRFGWMVEIDPYDPASVPVKRTALGRLKHEGAESIVNKDGRVVLYQGDDERFEYVYKFVTEGRFNAGDPAANRDLLDRGTLYVARFDADGTLAWLPLVFGQGPLTAANGFNSQADVVIDTRRAADLLKATPMDRPEDVEPNPRTNKVYVLLTNNSRRKAEQIDAANPRAGNEFGHIIEIAPADGDHAATTAKWEILVRCGDPSQAAVGALYNPATSANGWFASPDNCAIDGLGRLWIATDQGEAWAKSGTADGLWSMETEGSLRGASRMFFRVPVGAELCGPCFAPDDETLFLAIQHPGVDGAKDYNPFAREASFADPPTRWPDFQPNMPPRPSVVAITKRGGGKIGT